MLVGTNNHSQMLNKGSNIKIPVTDDNIQQEVYKYLDKGVTNLNFLDTSQVTDMFNLFSNMGGISHIDISEWDVSNVSDMGRMFANSDFNGDISNWNVKSLENIPCTFRNCSFNGDLSKWKPKKVKISETFSMSPLMNNFPEWYLK